MQQHGMALIVTLVFILILTAIVMNGIESGLLTTRLVANFQQETRVFQAAQTALVVAQAKIRGDTITLPPIKPTISYQNQLLATDPCQQQRYQINVTATDGGIAVHLVSEYEWLAKTTQPTCRAELGGKQMYWHEIDSSTPDGLSF